MAIVEILFGQDDAMSNKFSAMLKRLRLAKNVTLREFCLNNGFDPGNYSKLERGHFPPPDNRELLEKYARALEIKEGSLEWFEFFDLAAIEKGRIPDDILSDTEVVDKLPVLLRTMRGNPLSPEQLDKLIEKIRRS
jgi:transcriptional regulator with XRE-family HTH domain